MIDERIIQVLGRFQEFARIQVVGQAHLNAKSQRRQNKPLRQKHVYYFFICSTQTFEHVQRYLIRRRIFGLYAQEQTSERLRIE